MTTLKKNFHAAPSCTSTTQSQYFTSHNADCFQQQAKATAQCSNSTKANVVSVVTF